MKFLNICYCFYMFKDKHFIFRGRVYLKKWCYSAKSSIEGLRKSLKYFFMVFFYYPQNFYLTCILTESFTLEKYVKILFGWKLIFKAAITNFFNYLDFTKVRGADKTNPNPQSKIRFSKETFFGTSRASTMKLFCGWLTGLLAVNCFSKKAPS